MHYLHRILVKVNPNETREDQISSARNYAEVRTEDYYNIAWDWRETDTAGRWSDEYPVNVILAADDINKFVEELVDCKAAQMDFIKEFSGSTKQYKVDIADLFNDETLEKLYGASFHIGVYDLMLALEVLAGRYTPHSCFYNTDSGECKITEDLLNSVKQNPETYALVLFDYHY